MSEPTEKMIEYAIAIADNLGLDMPDFYDFGSVSRFIGKYANSYREYMKQQNFYSDIGSLQQTISKKFSDAFIDRIAYSYQNVSGLYFLFANEDLLYIGKSINLSERILSSFRQRYTFRKDINMVGVIEIPNLADLQMAEPYFISTLKPLMNKEFNVKDHPVAFHSDEMDAAYSAMIPFFIFEQEEE